jgi:hypothetical protein
MVNVILSWHYICKYCLALGVLGNCDKKINADGVVDISVATECVNTMCPQTSTMILNKESGTSNKGVIT